LDITWYGHSCFRITERGQTSIVTDPYYPSIGLPELALKADLVTVSHDQPGHNAVDLVKGYDYVVGGPGEYEIGELFVTGIPMHYHDEETGDVLYNVAYLFEYSNHMTVLHLGDLHHVPDQSTIEQLGEVNVLLIPVGGGRGLRAAQAADVIALVEPHYVVPMHYAIDGLNIELDGVDRFLKTMGVSQAQELDTLKVTSSTLPEQTQVILLQPELVQN
jgi:L-ascorbate metabolism protein UlaG (beta-lactamase superfamily)